jgi:hypothetical protein
MILNTNQIKKARFFLIKNNGSIGKYEYVKTDVINHNLQFKNGLYFLSGNWSTLKDQKQYALDQIRNQKIKLSHLIIIDNSKLTSLEIIEKYVKQKSKQFKWFNRAYRIENNLVFPNRNYIDFKGDNQLTIKEFE